MTNLIRHCEIRGKDVAELKRFYNAAFDWSTIGSVGDSYYILSVDPAGDGADADGVHVGLGSAEGADDHVTFYVEVDDPGAVLRHIEELGGRTIQPPEPVAEGPQAALFADPEGHVVGLVERHSRAGSPA